jgi:hypothetical protein
MALDEVTTSTQGSFMSKEMGGIRYHKNECVFAMQSDLDEGIGSRETAISARRQTFTAW